MSSLSRLKILYLLYLSQPAADRAVYKAIRHHRPCRIVEIGIGPLSRSLAMIGLAAQFHPAQEIHFTAFDLFEARPAGQGPRLTLRDAHRTFKATGARIQLVPGTPQEGLDRVANSLGQVDFLLIGGAADTRHLADAWFYVPRLLHDRSLVFMETVLRGGQPTMRLVDHAEIRLAAEPRRRAA